MSTRREQIEFVKNLTERFQLFLLESIQDGHHENFDDHFDFMKQSLEIFIDLEQEKTEGA